MIQWVFRKLFGCARPCEWETIREGKWTTNGHTTGFWYDQRCKRCGEIRTRNT